ncbi:MAG: hypothetical protein M3Q40_01310 [Pseudomonadota bacterium]|nr:hypothetical protein [Pseudomonadota bacterium]
MKPFLLAVGAALLASLCGCATSFPTAGSPPAFNDGLSAREVFDRSLAAHGGDIRHYPGDINLSTDGRWYALIKRIQPVVTDAGFRISSQERFRPGAGIYAVRHSGPEGVKQVVRTPDGLSVHYNGAPETDPAKLRATAMTNDAFQLFHFGPSFIHARATGMERIADAREDGRDYRRVLATLSPGFGEAAQDRVVLWIDARDDRLFRVHMTLNGFESTQGAHVDTTFLEYREVGPYLLPVRFHERVRGPLQIDAHRWWTTGIDLDRGWTLDDVRGGDFRGPAAAAAKPVAASSQ